MSAFPAKQCFLFGGSLSTAWTSDSWVAVDDRVRGGKSRSHLTISSAPIQGNAARFDGMLDIKTLGGAGFASQRTIGTLQWDFSGYDGISIQIASGDSEKFTFTLKDEASRKRPDGREQSTIVWEYDFIGEPGEIHIPWDQFKPTYRGRPKPNAKPLDLKNVTGMSIMMRSFFSEQEGPFCLTLNYIALSTHDDLGLRPLKSGSSTTTSPDPKSDEITTRSRLRKLCGLAWLCGLGG